MKKEDIIVFYAARVIIAIAINIDYKINGAYRPEQYYGILCN